VNQAERWGRTSAKTERKRRAAGAILAVLGVIALLGGCKKEIAQQFREDAGPVVTNALADLLSTFVNRAVADIKAEGD
jgi:hypothetical protein